MYFVNIYFIPSHDLKELGNYWIILQHPVFLVVIMSAIFKKIEMAKFF